MPPKWGVDLYTGSTYTRVNTVTRILQALILSPAIHERMCGKTLKAHVSKMAGTITLYLAVRQRTIQWPRFACALQHWWDKGDQEQHAEFQLQRK